jgi:hypothetical protein
MGPDQSLTVRLLLEKIHDIIVERDWPFAETDDAFDPRRPDDIMKFGCEMETHKDIVGEKRDDSFSFFGDPDQIETWKENVEAFQAQMKLRLFLFMRFTVNHIPVSLFIFHAAALRIPVQSDKLQQVIYQEFNASYIAE